MCAGRSDGAGPLDFTSWAHARPTALKGRQRSLHHASTDTDRDARAKSPRRRGVPYGTETKKCGRLGGPCRFVQNQWISAHVLCGPRICPTDGRRSTQSHSSPATACAWRAALRGVDLAGRRVFELTSAVTRAAPVDTANIHNTNANGRGILVTPERFVARRLVSKVLYGPVDSGRVV